MDMLDSFGRLPTDVLKYIMSFHITKPTFEFEIKNDKFPLLKINLFGSLIQVLLPEHTLSYKVNTTDLLNLLQEDKGRYQIVDEEYIVFISTFDNIVIDD